MTRADEKAVEIRTGGEFEGKASVENVNVVLSFSTVATPRPFVRRDENGSASDAIGRPFASPDPTPYDRLL
jgi:hypothetical protein